MLVRLLFISTLFFNALSTNALAATHYNISETDKLTECARSILHKPVLWWRGLWKVASQVGCPPDSKQLFARLRSTQVKVFEDNDWVYLFDAEAFPPWQPDVPEVKKIHWRSISTRVRTYNDVSSPVKLTEAELSQIQTEVIRSARTFWVEVPYAAAGVQSVVLPVEIRAVTARSRSGVRFTVALYYGGDQSESSRLVYGEWREEKYFVKWDSPLVPSFHASLSLKDMDADGRDEIVIESGTAEGMHSYPLLVAFSQDGKELTRQETDCNDYGDGPEGGACPIHGLSIEIVATPGIGDDLDILVRTDTRKSRLVRYHLIHGHYEPVRSH
ncbi:MAG TPA: hypothetical protein VI636_09500 [Candidatus Angelobacter sp.]